MATSGSTDFSLTRNQILEAALQRIGVLAAGETMSAEDMAVASRDLNLMIKTWQGQSLGFWLRQPVTLFLQPGQSSYTLGPASPDPATHAATARTVTTPAAAGASALVLDDVAGLSVGDQLGVLRADGQRQWTTVATITGATVGLGATLAAAVDAAASVFTYAQAIPDRVLQIRHLKWWGLAGNSLSIARNRLSSDQFHRLPDGTFGTPVQWFFEPGREAATLHLFPTPDRAERLTMTAKRPLYDFDNVADDPDFPQEWLETVITNLAVRLIPVFKNRVSPSAQLLIATAADLYDRLVRGDHEPVSFQFLPARRR
jgi:hypothetical protein